MVDITVGNMLSLGGIIAAVAGSYGVVQFRVGALSKDFEKQSKSLAEALDKEVSTIKTDIKTSIEKLAKAVESDIGEIRRDVRSAVDKKELDSFKREFDAFKSVIKDELGEIKSLLRNPQTGTSVFMLRTECAQHNIEICRLVGEINSKLQVMDSARAQARVEDAAAREKSENRISALWADVAMLRAETKIKKDDGK